jgi:hypothetical protein
VCLLLRSLRPACRFKQHYVPDANQSAVHSASGCSCRLPVALGPAEVYSSVDADTVLTVLTHKITKAVRTQVRQLHTIVNTFGTKRA